MTKRHFEQIAAVLAAAKTPTANIYKHPAESMRQKLARSLADVCAQTNAQFDRAWFLAACEVEVTEKTH